MKEQLLAFSIPGGNLTVTPVQIQTAPGMPTGGVDILSIAVQWGLSLIFVAAGIIALFFVIWGGISWITSAGEKEKIAEARNKILYALIGLVVIFSSYLIIRTVGGFFGIDPFEIGASHITCQGNPADQCGNNGFLHAVCQQGQWVCKYN